MAPHYRILLDLEGPLETPLHSGTLFGHLCWTWRHLRGASDLEAWLARLPEEPFLVSDGFPRGFVPKPLLRPGGLDVRGRHKELRKATLLRLEDFLELREAMSEEALAERLLGREGPAELTLVRVARNTIDRRTGTTPREGGGLYFVDEQWPAEAPEGLWRREEARRGDAPRDGTPLSRHRDVYASTPLEPKWLEELFRWTGEWGFGKDASLGRGCFRAKLEEAPRGLFEDGGSRCVSLSHGTLTAEMEEPRYRLHTQFGKVGSLFSVGHSPFKHPITLLRPGATFRPAGPGPFGGLLREVYPENPGVVQNAWHLTLSYSEEEDRG